MGVKEPPLYVIVERMREVLRRIEDQGGEVTPDIASELDALPETLERKGEAYAALILQLEGEASANAAMAEHYTKRKERTIALREKLRTRLLDAMITLGMQRIQAPTATITIQQSAGKLVVHDEQAALAAGWRKSVESLDKQGLKEWLERATVPCRFAEIQKTDYIKIR